MSIIHEPPRYAHDEGHTDVCYATDGETFITCGADGDVRIWSVDDGEDPKHTCIGEWALSVCQKNDKIYVATGGNDIQILTHPGGERDGVLTRATDPFNQIAMCKNKNIAILAGEGMDVTIMDLDTCMVKASFKDLGGPCLSVAICPNARKAAASVGDGYLRVWDVESSILLKELSCFPKVNSLANAKNLCRLDFDPRDGINLAYPEKNTIKLLNTLTWTQDTLSCSQVTTDFSVLQYSFCGKYLAGATVEGDFVIWETATKNVYQVSKHDSSLAICGLTWNPKGNGEIAYTDVEGQLSIMSNCSKLKRVQPASENKEKKVDENGYTENEVDFGDFIDEADKDGEDEEVKSTLGSGQLLSQGSSSKMLDEQVSSRASSPRPRTPEVPLQPSFMPSSTPEHLDPRYLCWNDVGVVKSYGNNSDDEMSSKSIEVEFHDSTFHNSMMLQNFQDYTMGSIGKGALVVANSSQVMIIPLMVSNKEWSLKVEEYEEILLVAASENLVCFATSNYLIRVCSVFGTQRGVVSVPGPLVSISAFRNILLVAYHDGGVRNGDQCVNMKIFKFEGLNVECHDIGSALGPESTLYWLGFSDLGTPAMMDSLGMLSLFPPKCNTWIPFCDTTKHRKSPGDGFFVTAIFESCQAVAGIKCKGSVYPGFVPRPTLCELPLAPPFAENTTDKVQMEMNMFTWSNLSVVDTERKYKETALKIFALACKNDLDQRAFEFMDIISNQQVLNLGLKYATKLNKRRLAEKLMELAARLQEDAQEEEPPRTFHTVPSTPDVQASDRDQVTVKPKALRLSLSKATPRNKKPKKEGTQPDGENIGSTVNTQESLFSEEPSSSSTLNNSASDAQTPSQSSSNNPFMKRPKKSNQVNPLSLTNKYAGVNYEKPATKPQNVDGSDKRKLSDSDTEKPAGKQRKLDNFMFSKRPFLVIDLDLEFRTFGSRTLSV